MKIFKYEIEIIDSQEIFLPEGAEILHVGLDPHGKPCIWFRVDPDAPPFTTTVMVRCTGHEISHEAKHVGTFVRGPGVWHVFTR